MNVMDSDLQQAIRDSAHALQYTTKIVYDGPYKKPTLYALRNAEPKSDWFEWNPVENEKQDRLLLHWLLENYWFIEYSPSQDEAHMIRRPASKYHPWSAYEFICPPNEFLTRATAAVWAVKESEK